MRTRLGIAERGVNFRVMRGAENVVTQRRTQRYRAAGTISKVP